MSGKKIIRLGNLALLSLLVACGPGEDTGNDSGEGENNEDITLYMWEDIDKSVGTEEAIRGFEEEYGVQVEVEERPYGDNIEDLRLDGPGGTGPDVFAMPHDSIGTAVLEGLISPIDIEEEIQNQFTEQVIFSQIVDEEVYGLPYAVETTLLYYNRDLVNEDELPETLNEWYDLSVEIVNNTDNYGFLALWDQIYYAQSILGGYGGYIFGQDSDGNFNPQDIGLDNEGAIEATEYIQRFYEEGLFPSGIIGEQGINVLDALFAEGNAAAVISGPWNLEPFEQAGVDYGVTSLPMLDNGDYMSSFIGVKSYNVSSFSEHSELAEELVKWLANEENQLIRYEHTQEVPAIESLANDPLIAESAPAEAIAEQTLVSDLMPNIPEMNEVWIPMDSALQTVATGSSEPEDALSSAVEEIENQIKSNH